VSPVTLLALFATLAVCAALLAAVGLKRPPPGFEDKQCEACKKLNSYKRESCEACGEPLKDRWDES